MPKLWTAEKLARDCDVAYWAVFAVALLIRAMSWITVDQFTILLAIACGPMVCARLIRWRIRKAAHALG
jgi:hypothetical protein